MKIGFITTSRADFGIYRPLLEEFKKHPDAQYALFVGGMHTDPRFGDSWKLIQESGFEIAARLDCLVPGYEPADIAASMGKTLAAYGAVWKEHKDLDMVFAMGDRFEMFAAASSLIPYNIPLAHLHGGETTLGAIDNKFRHAITCLSDYHFASNEAHAQKVKELTGSETHVYNVGALGIDSAMNLPLLSKEEFSAKFGFDVNREFILTTVHPETVRLGINKDLIQQITDTFLQLPYPVLCTLPNADTEGSVIREHLLEFEKAHPEKMKCFENLGQQGYLSAMKYCTLMLGNTSSGIIEAEGFGTIVVNVGNRQQGRLSGDNVIHVAGTDTTAILAAVNEANKRKGQPLKRVYGNGTSARQIFGILKQITDGK